MVPRVLVVAGSDSGGGAGIQADLRAVSAFGGHAATAITALTAQDTRGVGAVHPVPPDFVALQIRMALADPGADAVKLGMLGDVAAIEAVSAALDGVRLPIVLDPVMVAKGGAALLEPAALGALRRLLPRAALVTPNLPEAAALIGRPVRTEAEMHEAIPALLALGARAVLLKGGHLPGEQLLDLLATADGLDSFMDPRIPTRHTHGTGCTLASAIAVRIAAGQGLRDAVAGARAYLRAAILAAPGIGAGHGPVGMPREMP